MRSVFLEGKPLPIFPLYWNKKPACGSHGFKDASADPSAIAELWRRYPDCPLVGVPTGSATGLAVIDIDPRRDGDVWLATAGLPTTRVHATLNRGYHLLFRHPPGLRNSQDLIAPGVEVKADGGFVVWWPAAGGQVFDGPIAELPAWVLAAVRNGSHSLSPRDSFAGDDREARGDGSALSVLPRSREASYAHVALKAAMDELLNAPRGERNSKLNVRAYNLGRLAARGWITVPQVVQGLELVCQYNGLTRDDGEGQVRATIVSGLRAGMERPYPDDMFRKAVPLREQPILPPKNEEWDAQATGPSES